MVSNSGNSVESPCVNVCELDAGQVCTGCGRSLAEIAEWSQAGDHRRRSIKTEALRRLAIIEAVSSPSSSSGASRR